MSRAQSPLLIALPRPGSPVAAGLVMALLLSPLGSVSPAIAGPKAATISISSTTRGAKIFVNDEEVGEVPLAKPIEVKAGATYTVRIQKRGFTPYVSTVLAGTGQNSEIEADLVPSGGVVKVACNVPRSQVLIDGKPFGRTPFDGDVAPGKHKLQVASTGYVTDTRDIEVKAGDEIALDVKLDLVPKPIEIENKAIWAKWWFWGGVGAVVVGGVTAAVLATQEDHVTPEKKFGGIDKTVNLP